MEVPPPTPALIFGFSPCCASPQSQGSCQDPAQGQFVSSALLNMGRKRKMLLPSLQHFCNPPAAPKHPKNLSQHIRSVILKIPGVPRAGSCENTQKIPFFCLDADIYPHTQRSYQRYLRWSSHLWPMCGLLSSVFSPPLSTAQTIRIRSRNHETLLIWKRTWSVTANITQLNWKVHLKPREFWWRVCGGKWFSHQEIVCKSCHWNTNLS